MAKNKIPGMWEARQQNGKWQVLDDNGKLIATLADGSNVEDKVKLIIASPYMLEALKAVIELIGDEDLPDNGEYNGAAVCDMARSAVEMVTGDK